MSNTAIFRMHRGSEHWIGEPCAGRALLALLRATAADHKGRHYIIRTKADHKGRPHRVGLHRASYAAGAPSRCHLRIRYEMRSAVTSLMRTNETPKPRASLRTTVP